MEFFCKKCNCKILEKESRYSLKNFKEELCREHQKDFSNQNLTEKKSTNSFNMIKGRIAETLIEELFLQLNYNVFRYGMENTIPGVMKLLKGIKDEVATNIRTMPDFVIQKGEDIFFIEVKFRKNEKLAFKDLKKNYPYHNCYFILVSKKHIKIITYGELKNGKEISPTSKNYLGSRKEFNLDKNVIIEYCKFAILFFKNID
jgi:hypothetical protein